MGTILRMLGKNPAPKCCGQHMRSQDHMPSMIAGVKGKCYRCRKCGRVNINPGGVGPSRPNMTPRVAPSVVTYRAPCPVCGRQLESQSDHDPSCRFAPVA